jgi:hypothetical protein
VAAQIKPVATKPAPGKPTKPGEPKSGKP